MFKETTRAYLRVRQIRLTGFALSWLAQLPLAQRLIGFLRVAPVSRALYRLAVGYQRPFGTLAEAEVAVSAFADQGHVHPANADIHLELNKTTRPSDYAALFHLQRLLPSIRRIFDLGGNVGNLYYCYETYLNLPIGFSWQVQDLPENMARGRALALEREADRLSFADTWSEASGADLILVSGGLALPARTPCENAGEAE